MKRKILTLFLCVAIVLSTVSMVGCGLIKTADDYDIVEVSTFDELVGKSNGRDGVKLTADLDGGGQTISAINIPYLDGDGHTISNCTVTSSDHWFAASFLGNTAKTVKNVTFSNINVSSSKASGAAIVSAGFATSIENVHVKDSTVTATQIDKNSHTCYYGVIFGGSYALTTAAPQENEECVIKNCSVSNCTVEINGIEKSTADMYAGGVCGVAKEVTNCKVSNTTIKVEAKNDVCMASAGGAIGLAKGKVENVSVDTSSVEVKNNRYWEGSTGITTGGDGRLGGVVAVGNEDFNATKSFAKNVSLTGVMTAEIYAGGFGGRITKGSIGECYALDVSVKVSGYVKKNMDDAVQRNVGGFAGEIKNCTVTSSFAHNFNKLEANVINDNSQFDDRCESRICGFAGKITSSTVSRCATAMGNTIANGTGADKCDEFSVTTSGVSNCYITNIISGNKANCAVVESDFWASEAIATLGLTGTEWSYINGIPQLTLA